MVRGSLGRQDDLDALERLYSSAARCCAARRGPGQPHRLSRRPRHRRRLVPPSHAGDPRRSSGSPPLRPGDEPRRDPGTAGSDPRARARRHDPVSHGWRWIFYINLPISLVALALAWWGLPISPRPRASAFDWVGFAFLSPGLAALVYGLSLAGTSGSFLALPALPWLGAGALLVAGFIATALLKGDAALINLGLMRQRSFAAVSCLTFLFGIAIYGPMFLLPLYFQWVWGDQAFPPA